MEEPQTTGLSEHLVGVANNGSAKHGLEAYPFPEVTKSTKNVDKALPAIPNEVTETASPLSNGSAENSSITNRPHEAHHSVDSMLYDGSGSPTSLKKPTISRKPVPSSESNLHIRRVSEGQTASGELSRGASDFSTSREIRNVQFSRDTLDNEQGDGITRPIPPFLNGGGGEDQQRGKNPSFYSKLKALATNPSFTSSRGLGEDNTNGATSEGQTHAGNLIRSQTYGSSFPMTLEEGNSSDDADAEDSGVEDDRRHEGPRHRLAPLRLTTINSSSAPSSPRSSTRSQLFHHQTTSSPDGQPRSRFLPRRATDSVSPHAREGVSEDEGRARMRSRPRRKPGWSQSFIAAAKNKVDDQGTAESKRPGQLRRLTAFASPGLEGGSPSPWRRHKPDRGTSLSGQKWRQIKAGLKLMGQRPKRERTIDHEKSAELLAELMAGSPAALMFASMFQRDERGNKKIPVLLEQLKVRITDSEVDKHGSTARAESSDRPTVFRIELEYGNGVNRMRWVVKRSLRDFAEMHAKYKLYYQGKQVKQAITLRETRVKRLPKFPMSAFPYMRTWRGFEDEGEEEEEEAGNETEGASGTDRPSQKQRQRSSFAPMRRKSSTPVVENGGTGGGGTATTPGGTVPSNVKRESYPERQRKKLETYLQKMITFMLFQPESNRLCRFLELSALGMRLAAEGSYHGMEGYVTIRSAKGVDFRKVLTPSNFANRHSPKWFLVRHSYVVCVDSPEEMHIYDVFLFDSNFSMQSKRKGLKTQDPKEMAKAAREATTHPQHHRLKLTNSERTLKLLARNEKVLHGFEESIRVMVEQSPWVKENRFQSFAPVRHKCFAQWLVDGRDHMWVVSRAINQAKDVIYIHDWWLSPELYMRRPPAISQKWRIDRLLKKKAEEGVKIFVIMYRNIESAIPIDSEYSKFSLLDLHPNVFVQRSPNQIRQNTFFWAHHEKLCLIDHTVAFVGGIDLCFGRWDTPQHPVVDDKPTGFEDVNMPKDAEHCQLWPGKDYSNPRIQDFFALHKPYEEMYDREEIPRMPWHDISMQVVGQPARDLTRHFVQRWNYILRQRKPTRPTPFLLPPPDFNPADLEALGLDGSCEVQILRSCGPWSIGTPDKTEHSIMTAYCKLIEHSEHLVYIENQFFITSCSTEATQVQNTIGDALVERAIRASKNDEAWRAIIIIPLIPGFQNTVAEAGGTSVRLIMQYQYRSICRGESSIFGRLRTQGIDPEEYIQFYSLRNWGKIGPRKMLVTEQLYIHAKCMIVDDRVAIIGSANINERSMLGDRDSEVASIVRDTDMIWSRMNGNKYLVGRFPHTLRMRLMREHLGLDVDKIMEETPVHREPTVPEEQADDEEREEGKDRLPSSSRSPNPSGGTMSGSAEALKEGLLDRLENIPSFNHDVDWEQAENPNLKAYKRVTEDARVTGNAEHRKDVIGEGPDEMNKMANAGLGVGRDSELVHGAKEVLTADLAPEGRGTLSNPKKRGTSSDDIFASRSERESNPPMPPRPAMPHMTTVQLGLPMLSQLPALPNLDDSDIGGPNLDTSRNTELDHPLVSELHLPMVDVDCMKDPVIDTFLLDTWQAVAENNTKIYRTVFRCMPDNEVKDWKSYNEYVSYDARFKEMQGASGDWKPKDKGQAEAVKANAAVASGPPGVGQAPDAVSHPILAAAEVPLTAKEKATDLKDKFMSVMADSNDEVGENQKDRLRQWAAEANRAQFERQDKERRQSMTQSRSSQDEKLALNIPNTVPESSAINHYNGSTDVLPPTSSISQPSDINSPLSPIQKQPTQPFVGYSEALNMNYHTRTTPRRRRATTNSRRGGPGIEFMASHDIPTTDEAEQLLGMIQGHLIAWPYEWLEKVESGGNWLFAKDNLTPLEI